MARLDKDGLNAFKTSLAESNPTLSILLTELILKQKTVLILAAIGAFVGALIWIYKTFLKSSPEKQVKSMIKKAPHRAKRNQGNYNFFISSVNAPLSNCKSSGRERL